MKFRAIFNLIQDAQDLCEVFSKVETPEQMVSALERLKRQGTMELLDDVASLRLSVEAALEDMLEIGGGVEADDEQDAIADDLLDGITEGVEDESQGEGEVDENAQKEASGGSKS